MPASIPDAATLLAAAIKYLEDELMPELSGYHRFKTRVTINVLGAIRREFQQQLQQAARERARLIELLEHDGAIEELNRELAQTIRGGKFAIADERLTDHVRESLRAALQINNPGWLK